MQVKLHSKFNFLSGGIIILFLLVTAVWADIYYEMTSTDYSSTPGGETTEVDHQEAYVKSDRMKSEDLTDKQATIIRLDKELIWEIDHSKKTYSQVTFAELEELYRQQEAAMKQSQQQMTKMMESLPPEQRAMAEKQMQQAMEAQAAMAKPAKVTKTGKKDKILGYTCQQYKVSWANMTWDMWVSEEVAPEIDVSKFYKGLIMAGPLGEGLSEVKGAPLKTVLETEMAGTHSRYISEVTKVKTKKISDDEFELPKGYREVPYGQEE
jgi:flagellar biosynthesis GTPase FlhF